ncbi:MAG: hypothetical protein IJ041_07465 [Clostridia bacterium]|nr:hypothetical protein [Clostridia bacterium]
MGVPVIRFSNEHDAEGRPFLFRRYAPGTELEMDLRDCIAVLKDGDYTVHMHPPGQTFVCPQEGDTYAVNCRDTDVNFGFRELGSYTAANIAGRCFPLGFYGVMRVRCIHINGLRGLMHRTPEATFSWLRKDGSGDHYISLLQCTLDELCYDLKGIVAELLGAEPEFHQLQARQAELESALEAYLSRRMYACGVYLWPGTLKIQGFTQAYAEG